MILRSTWLITGDIVRCTWWLSFVDPARPCPEHFLGACIVHADDPKAAIIEAGARGCNPGGQVGILRLKEDRIRALSFELAPYENRLLSPIEAREFTQRLAEDLTS